MVANVICISQGVIIFCPPNKTDTKKKTPCDADLSCFMALAASALCGIKLFIIIYFFTHTLCYPRVSWTLRVSCSAPHLKVALNLFLTAPITCVLVQLVTVLYT